MVLSMWGMTVIVFQRKGNQGLVVGTVTAASQRPCWG